MGTGKPPTKLPNLNRSSIKVLPKTSVDKNSPQKDEEGKSSKIVRLTMNKNNAGKIKVARPPSSDSRSIN